MTIHFSFSYATAFWLMGSVVCFLLWLILELGEAAGGLILTLARAPQEKGSGWGLKTLLLASVSCFIAALWTCCERV